MSYVLHESEGAGTGLHLKYIQLSIHTIRFSSNVYNVYYKT